MNLLDFLKDNKDAIGILILGPAALWAVWTYHKSKKKESSEWLHKLFISFYLSNDVYPIRTAIEFESETRLRPVIERMLINEDLETTKDERRILCDVDTLLNYFEFILYLEEKRQISRADCEKLFDYWFSLLNKPSVGYLRLYCHRFGYEGICEKITGQSKCSAVPEYIAFYGSLMKGRGKQESLMIKDALELVGPCQIGGSLCDLGEFPGLIAGKGTVKAELYKVKDRTVFDAIDKYEEFSVADPASSLFVRHVVRLEKPQLDAWVYFYNRSINSSLDHLPRSS